MKVGDLIRDKRWIEDGYAIIVSINWDNKEPYEVYCYDMGTIQHFPRYYVEQECEVIA